MKKPLFILAAAPKEAVKLKDVFESKSGSVIELLRNPGELRYAGWDLQTLDTPKIIKGEYLEVKNGDRKTINIYEDGTLIFRGNADHEFLGWPRNEKTFVENPRLNSIAVVELTYNFVDFYQRLAKHFISDPKEIFLRIEIKNAFLNGTKLYIVPYDIGTYGGMFDSERHEAPEDNMTRDLLVKIEELYSMHLNVAYMLVEKLFLWFGVASEKIPYVTQDKNQNKIIDIEKIKEKK